MLDVHTAPHTVHARFVDLRSARQGIAALERAGVPGSDIHLEGGSAEKAAKEADTSVTDEAFMQEAEKTLFGGAAVGAGGGAILGLVAGVVFLDASWLAIAITVAGGVAAGGGLGFIGNAMVRLQQTDAAELTYHDVDGNDVYVTVRTEGRDVDEITQRLRRTGAVSVEQLDAERTLSKT